MADSAPTITTKALPNAHIGAYYEYQLTATGSQQAPAWSAKGLPRGITLSNDGLLAGNPTEADLYGVDVSATTVVGGAKASFTLLVDDGLVSDGNSNVGPVANLLAKTKGSTTKNFAVTLTFDSVKKQIDTFLRPDENGNLVFGTEDVTAYLISWYKYINYGQDNQTLDLVSADVVNGTGTLTYSVTLPKGIYAFIVSALDNSSVPNSPVQLKPSPDPTIKYVIKPATIVVELLADGDLVGVTSDYTKAVNADNPTYIYLLNNPSGTQTLKNAATGTKAGLGIATSNAFVPAPALFGEVANTAMQAGSDGNNVVNVDITNAPFHGDDTGISVEFICRPATDTIDTVLSYVKQPYYTYINNGFANNVYGGMFVGPNGLGFSAVPRDFQQHDMVITQAYLPNWTPGNIYHVVVVSKDNTSKIYVNGVLKVTFDANSVQQAASYDLNELRGLYQPTKKAGFDLLAFGRKITNTGAVANDINAANGLTPSGGDKDNHVVNGGTSADQGTSENVLSHWSLFDHGLTAAQVLAHYNALIGLVVDPTDPTDPTNPTKPTGGDDTDGHSKHTTTCADYGTCPYNGPDPGNNTPPTITTTKVNPWQYGVKSSYTMRATGSKTITWTAKDLPSWVTLDKSTGKLSGKGPGATSTEVLFTATNSLGHDSKSFTIASNAKGNIIGPVLPPDGPTGDVVEYVKNGNTITTIVNGEVVSVDVLTPEEIATYYPPTTGWGSWYPAPGANENPYIVTPVGPYDPNAWLYVDTRFQEPAGVGTPWQYGYTWSSKSVIIAYDDAVQASQLLLEDDLIGARFKWRGGKANTEYYRISGRGANALFLAGFGYMLKAALV